MWTALRPSASARHTGSAGRRSRRRAEPDELETLADRPGYQRCARARCGADADQMLDHHRLVPRCGPQDRRRQSRVALKALEHLLGRDLGDDGVW